jgi:hypothetical protein
LSHFQYGRQAAILNFACSADNFRMLGPVQFKVCMLIDGHPLSHFQDGDQTAILNLDILSYTSSSHPTSPVLQSSTDAYWLIELFLSLLIHISCCG